MLVLKSWFFGWKSFYWIKLHWNPFRLSREKFSIQKFLWESFYWIKLHWSPFRRPGFNWFFSPISKNQSKILDNYFSWIKTYSKPFRRPTLLSFKSYSLENGTKVSAFHSITSIKTYLCSEIRQYFNQNNEGKDNQVKE